MVDESDRMQELLQRIDAQIKERETERAYLGDRRRVQDGPPQGQQDRRQGIDRRGRARASDPDDK